MSPQEPTETHAELNVYFVGHSLIGEVIPQMLVAIGREKGVQISYVSQLIDGGTLMRNWEEPETSRHHASAELEAHLDQSAQAALESGAFDVVLLTEAVNLDDSLRWSASEAFTAKFYQAALRGNADTRLFFYETWHHHDADRSIDFFRSDLSWREQLSADLDKWEHIVDGAQPEVEQPIYMVPGGQFMAALLDEIETEQVPSAFDSRDVFFADNVHLSPLGAYAVSLVMFYALTGVDPEGAPSEIDFAAGEHFSIAPADARWLAHLAKRVAASYPRTFTARPR